MRKYFLLLVILINHSLYVLAQPNPAIEIDSLRLDSLKRMVPLAKDSTRVDLLNDIATRIGYGGYTHREDSVRYYSRKAYDEAKKIGYQSGIARGLIFFSGFDLVQNKPIPDEAKTKENIEKGIKIAESLNNYQVLGWGYYFLAGLSSLKSSFATRVDLDNKSINAFLKGGDTLHAAELANWVFDEYFYRGEYEKAFEFGKRSVELSKKSRVDISLSWHQFLVQYSLGNMSALYAAAGDYENAMNYLVEKHQYGIKNQTGWVANGDIAQLYCQMGKYDSAVVYWNLWRNHSGWKGSADGHKAWGNNVLGVIYLNTGKYDKAIEIFQNSVVTFKKFNNKGALAPTYLNLAKAYEKKKNYKTALQYATDGLGLAKEKSLRPHMMEGYQLLSSIHHSFGNDAKAYQNLLNYNSIKDSIQNKQFLLRMYSSRKEVEETRKTSRINLLNKENQLKKSELKQQAMITNGLIAGLVLIICLGIFIFRIQLLKRKNERLKLQRELEVRQLEGEKKQTELQQRASELEMQALRAQMNPHFIFNCLSSINKFILKNESQAASDYLTRFSRLIRRVLTNSQLSTIPLSDEIEMLKLYLDMERLRFDNSFDYNIVYANAIEPDTIYIPPMLLQPFCENAIWHGLMHKEGQGKLGIEMSTQNGELHCVIADNGIGRSKAAELKSKSGEKQKSFGLKITTERLALFNNEKDSKSYYNTEEIYDDQGAIAGTKVKLVIKYKDAVHNLVNKAV
jgi:tetratricopeptide (TPR) repeat protein